MMAHDEGELQKWPPVHSQAGAAVSHGGSRPVAVQCAAARILRGSAHYIIVVRCEDGRRWAVAKRFSHFDNFRKLITPVLARLAPGTDQLPFPPKTPFGSGTSSETVELRMETFEQWLSAIIDIITDDHIAESVVDGCTLTDEAAMAEQKLCIFLAEDESVDVKSLQSLGLGVRSSMLTEQAKQERADYMEPREMPEIIRRRCPPDGSPAHGMGSRTELLGIVDDANFHDDDTGPSPRGGVWKENEPLPLQSWDVEPPPHLAATRKLQGRTLSGRTPPASPAQPGGSPNWEQHEQEHGSFVLRNPDRVSSDELENEDALLVKEATQGRQPDETEVVEGNGIPVVVSFGVGRIGIQYRLAQGSWAKGVTFMSGRDKVLVIERIVPGGLASMCTQLQSGQILTKINGESVKGQRHEHMMRRMREAPRPLNLTFEAALSPAARITAAIKSRTAAAIVAASSSSIDLSRDDTSRPDTSLLMTLGHGETDAVIAQLRNQLEEEADVGEASYDLSPSTKHGLDDEDGSSEVGSGDGNLSSTPDSTSSADVSLCASVLAKNSDDGQEQACIASPSPAATTERSPARRSRTRGLRGLNGDVTPRKIRSDEAVSVDESIEIGLGTEDRRIEGRCQPEWQTHMEKICVSFVREGPIGLELTVSAHDRRQHPVAAVVIRAIRPGTQAKAHVPPLCPGLVLMSVGDVDVRGLSLDEVHCAIVKHNRRPLMITFVTPVSLGRLQGQDPTAKEYERQQPLALGQIASQRLTGGGKEEHENENDTHRTSVRRYLAENGMEACTDGVCRALAQHGTERSQWLSTLTSMGSATRRDLLEAVRAQYARESPLRSLARRDDTTAATTATSVAPALDGDDSGSLLLDESVEQVQSESNVGHSQRLGDVSAELSLPDPEKIRL